MTVMRKTLADGRTREVDTSKPVTKPFLIQRDLAALEALGFSKKQKNTLVFVASEPVQDRFEDVVLDSWRLDNYALNPVFLVNHKSGDLPVGRSVQTVLVDRRLVAEIEFDEEDKEAIRVKRKYDKQFMNAVSVGFMPGRRRWRDLLDSDHEYYLEGPSWGMLYEDNELLEISAATIPALTSALQQRNKEPGKGDIDDLFRVAPEQPEGDLWQLFTPPAPLDDLFQPGA